MRGYMIHRKSCRRQGHLRPTMNAKNNMYMLERWEEKGVKAGATEKEYRKVKTAADLFR